MTRCDDNPRSKMVQGYLIHYALLYFSISTVRMPFFKPFSERRRTPVVANGAPTLSVGQISFDVARYRAFEQADSVRHIVSIQAPHRDR